MEYVIGTVSLIFHKAMIGDPLGILLAVALVVAGCSEVSYTPAQDHNSLASTEFSHYLSQQPMVTYDELCRAVLLTADGEDAQKSFEERDSALKGRGIARTEWSYDAGHVVDRGTLAYMILQVSQSRKGLNSTLAGWTGIGCERYALKDVAVQKLMSSGLPYQVPTGGEVVRALASADDYMAKKGLYASEEKIVTSPRDVD